MLSNSGCSLEVTASFTDDELKPVAAPIQTVFEKKPLAPVEQSHREAANPYSDDLIDSEGKTPNDASPLPQFIKHSTGRELTLEERRNAYWDGNPTFINFL